MFIDQKTLIGLLDNHFAAYLKNEQYEILEVSPRSLITHSRIDLAIKILHLELANIEHVSFAKDLYINHIKAFSLGSFKEPGNSEKFGIQKFLADFDNTFKSISKNGIDSDRSVIPLTTDLHLANGSHRVASAYVAKKTVPTVSFFYPEQQYDASFFLDRGMGQQEIEQAVTKFIECADNCYIALIWPSAVGHDNEILQKIPNIIYKSSISLNYKAAQNLLAQIYYGENWLGKREDNYPGVKNKLIECFNNFDPIRVVAFQSESLNKTLSIKNEIRSIFNLDKHSVHISDTKEEAIRIARMLFSNNSLHFLKHGNPNKYPSTIKKIEKFKNYIKKNNISDNDVVIDSSFILSVYGLRESQDIDFLARNANIIFHDETIESHDSEIPHHKQEKNELIYNSKYYFYFEDLKFISFDQLYNMKENRSEKKDNNDLIIMSALREDNFFKALIGITRQKYFYFNTKLKVKCINALKIIGLYNSIRLIYRYFKKRREL